MNKFSIIITCYNAEEFIGRCLDSIMNQNYKNFEVIIINDGSTDRSLEIIKKYQMTFKNIKCINQVHKGVACARNNGIKHIEGNKFIFVDADDYINQYLLFHLNKTFTEKNSDIVRYSANLITKNGIDNKKYFCKKFDIVDGKEVLKLFVDCKVRYGPLWLYCYDTNFFLSNKFQFLENKIHEDFYNIYILSKASTIKGIDYIGYNYEKNNKSITANKDKKNELMRAKDILFVYDYVIKKLEESFINKKELLDYIYDDVMMFLNIPLKYLYGDNRENYLKEINIRKKSRRKYKREIHIKNNIDINIVI